MVPQTAHPKDNAQVNRYNIQRPKCSSKHLRSEEKHIYIKGNNKPEPYYYYTTLSPQLVSLHQ